MDPNQVVEELLQSHSGPCALDKIYLPYDQSGAGPAAKFGLGSELYFSEPDRGVLREHASSFLSDYAGLFKQRVNQFLPREARRTVKFSDDLVEKIERDYAKYPVETGYGTSILGAVDIGVEKDDVPPYQAHVVVRRESSSDLSYFTSFTPVCADTGTPNFDLLLAAVLRWCERYRPTHGGAGFTLIFSPGMSQNTKYALPLMKRFPGFDYIYGVDFSMEAGAVHDRFKCVNWLTVLGDEIVTELGGAGPMRAALEPTCKIHEYAGGVVIQAGENPQLGDATRGDIPEAYRKVARYTKPVRFEAYSSRLFRVPDNLDKKEETLSWIRRFD
ncbi:type VI immunity family protein [Burkholderia ambifaria]|nr:type VI immunity family protein [Burkholderia ambifaria]